MSFEISFRALEIFVAAAETRSMADAARRLRASPSTISQQIANLEQSLGARLVDRSARPIALTAAGKRFLVHAHRILDNVSSAQSDMMDLKLSSLPALRLALIDGLDLILTPELMIRLQALYPHCHLSAWSGKTEENLRALLEREVDLIVNADAQAYHESLERHPLLKEPLIVVAAPGLLGRSRDLRAELEAAPLVRYADHMPLGRLIEGHLRRVRMSPPRHQEFDSTRTILATLQRIRGWALTTPICLLDNPDFCDNLECLAPPFPSAGRTISLWARRDELAGLPRRLSELCRSILQQGCVTPGLTRMPWLEGRLKILEGDDDLSATPEREAES